MISISKDNLVKILIFAIRIHQTYTYKYFIQYTLGLLLKIYRYFIV